MHDASPMLRLPMALEIWRACRAETRRGNAMRAPIARDRES